MDSMLTQPGQAMPRLRPASKSLPSLMSSGKIEAVRKEHAMRTGSERNGNLPDHSESMKWKRSTEALPNSRRIELKPTIPRHSDFLSDLK